MSELRVSMIGPVPRSWGGRTPGGGVTSHIAGLLPALQDAGVEIRLLADNIDPRLPQPIPTNACSEFKTAIRPSLSTLPTAIQQAGIGRLLRLLARLSTNKNLRQSAPFAYRLRFALQAAQIQASIPEHHRELLHVHHAEFRQFNCQQVLQYPQKLVATVHSVSALVRPHAPWLESLIRTNYRRADWLIAVSNYVRQKALEYGAPPERISVIPNGVDCQFFTPGEQAPARKKLDLPAQSKIYLFIGNLIPFKGVDILIQAFARLPEGAEAPYLVFAGSGLFRAELEKLATALGVRERVIFTGYQPPENLLRWFHAANAFVLPSRAEGLSMALLEAMACGLPVITTQPDQGEHDAVIPGVNGFLIPFGDIEGLTKAMRRLAHKPAEAQAMGSAGRHRAEKDFSWQLIAAQTARVYQRVLQGAGKRHA